MADKIYLPETIETQPLPVIGDLVIPAEPNTASYVDGSKDRLTRQGETIDTLSKIKLPEDISGRFSEAKVVPMPQGIEGRFPEPIIASAIKSASLDSQARKILGNFSFGVLGAIQVGTYVLGTSGDIKISPSGVVARNTAGVTTFSLDGQTGDATFLGTLTAGTVIAGSVITGSVTITGSGVIQIGSYVNGVSGDIRIIPSGVIARNASGSTTFSIDGTTGAAIFMGTIAAGAVIAGSVITGGVTITGSGQISIGTYSFGVSGDIRIIPSGIIARNINGATTFSLDGSTGTLAIYKGQIVIQNDSDVTSIDSKGVVSTANFTTSGASAASLNQNIGSGSADVTGSSMSFTLSRAKTILFIATANCSMVESAGNTGNGYIYIDIDGVEYYANRMIWASGNGALTSGCSFVIYPNMSAGNHTVKLVGHQDILSGSTSIFKVYSFNFSYNQLGT